MVALDAAGGPGGGPADGMRIRIEVEVPSDVRYIEKIVDLVARQCATLSFSPRHCSLNVPVALTEALSNAILRGNKGDAEKQVRVRARVDEEQLVLEVGDQGPGFDLDASTNDATKDENLLREDGRGLFLMRRLMDRVERYDDHGNGDVVRLTLRRP